MEMVIVEHALRLSGASQVLMIAREIALIVVVLHDFGESLFVNGLVELLEVVLTAVVAWLH